ncbi:hypothetical protein [Micromonospora sp. NBS 11-29]|uniref:hypothetical protein n=1 Tax=Micromonospora sp. NBS 11-29 TaxID=1960879 RepID=UPI0020CCD4ED|nr:hypothetical protein [Micromonospora sp. NBS 11-29]
MSEETPPTEPPPVPGREIIAPPPAPGTVLHLTRAASPQFARPIMARVIRVREWSTFDGWRWIDVYQLAPDGSAIARRTLFVRLAGVRSQNPPPAPQRRSSPFRAGV